MYGQETKELLARLLCHRTSTAERFYKNRTKEQDAVKASNLVREMFSKNKDQDDDALIHDALMHIDEEGSEVIYDTPMPSPQSHQEFHSEDPDYVEESQEEESEEETPTFSTNFENSVCTEFALKNTGRGRPTFTYDQRKSCWKYFSTI